MRPDAAGGRGTGCPHPPQQHLRGVGRGGVYFHWRHPHAPGRSGRSHVARALAAAALQRVCNGGVPAVYRLCNVRVRVDRRLPHAPQHFLATIAYLRGVNLRGFANPSHPHFYGQQNADHWCICVYIRESHARMQMSLWMYMPLRRPEMMYAYIETDSDRGRLCVQGRSLVHMRVGTYIIRTYADARGRLHVDLLPSWPSGPICSSSVFTLSPSVCTLSSRLRALVR